MTETTFGDYGRVAVPARRRYIGPCETFPSLYGSEIAISIPEPDGELMLEIIGPRGEPLADAYFDYETFKRTVRKVLRAYRELPDAEKRAPARRGDPMPPVDRPHP